MPRKFPEVALSGECSCSTFSHFYMNYTHEALHSRCVNIFPDMTDGQCHFIILQGSARPFFTCCPPRTQFLSHGFFTSQNFHSIFFSFVRTRGSLRRIPKFTKIVFKVWCFITITEHCLQTCLSSLKSTTYLVVKRGAQSSWIRAYQSSFSRMAKPMCTSASWN